MTKHIGILTSGGDCPGLNAAIRGVAKACAGIYDMEVIGFRDGFKGLMQDRTVKLDASLVSGILTDGGTILGTSREKPHKMNIGGKICDMTDAIVDVYHKHHLDALVCLGGGGTQKNSLRLKQKGLNVITLPKTIDNDVFGTDITFGFDRHDRGRTVLKVLGRITTPAGVQQGYARNSKGKPDRPHRMIRMRE